MVKWLPAFLVRTSAAPVLIGLRVIWQRFWLPSGVYKVPYQRLGAPNSQEKNTWIFHKSTFHHYNGKLDILAQRPVLKELLLTNYMMKVLKPFVPNTPGAI